jgi:P pilus assembly chaperone PapD
MQRLLILLLISFLGISMQSIAQGDLLITPKRIVFEGNKQKETLNLANMGKDTATYSISFMQYAGSGRTTGNHAAIQA